MDLRSLGVVDMVYSWIVAAGSKKFLLDVLEGSVECGGSKTGAVAMEVQQEFQ